MNDELPGEFQPQPLLDFWFGPPPYQVQKALWWGGAENDQAISKRWKPLVDAALVGQLEHWCNSPAGNLALIIASDQLTRNIYRGQGQAFAGDTTARACVASGLARGDLADYHPLEALFFLMPLEHHEHLSSQDQMIELLQSVADRSSPQLKPVLDSTLDFALQHREIIARFGRFPHRNKALGRSSTPEELAYLADGGRRFGQ